jgi:beta-glucosidase
VLLAHASASKLYQQKYKSAQGGQVSFTTLVTWPEPVSGSSEDRRAAQNMLDSEVGWFLDPVFFGNYPGGWFKGSLGWVATSDLNFQPTLKMV